MIDIVIRHCGRGEWLPIIHVAPHCGSAMVGKELYRGNRMASMDAAFLQAKKVWEEGGTGNIVEFKREQML